MMPTSNSTSEAGYSLLELLVVLVIISLMTSLAANVGPARRGRIDLIASADRAVRFVREVHGSALRTGRIAWVTTSPDTGELERSDGARLRLRGATVSLTTTLTGRTPGRIAFYADGSSDGGSIALDDGGDQVRIHIDWLTGAVAEDAG